MRASCNYNIIITFTGDLTLIFRSEQVRRYALFGEVIHEYNAYWHQGKVPDYLFSGKQLDEENGMYYFEARYYNPPTFISRDPLFEKYPTMSPYAYTLNNPLRFIDPDGRRVFAHDRTSKQYMKSYFREQFGSTKMFRFNSQNELRINKGQFNKVMSSGNSNQKMMLEGMKKAIEHETTAKVKVQATGDNVVFQGDPPIISYRQDGMPIYGNSPESTMPLGKRSGGTSSGDVNNLGYTAIGINHSKAENQPYSIDGDNGTSKKGNASSVFIHELLDEFLNFNLEGNINPASPKIDKVQYQNAALKNLGLPPRNGSDHE
jgi:RHS repeat-associated protein